MTSPRRSLDAAKHAALKTAEDGLAEVREGFESADAYRLTGQWAAERSMVGATRAAIARTMESLAVLRELL